MASLTAVIFTVFPHEAMNMNIILTTIIIYDSITKSTVISIIVTESKCVELSSELLATKSSANCASDTTAVCFLLLDIALNH